MGASGGSTAELSPLTDHAKNGWQGLTLSMRNGDPPFRTHQFNQYDYTSP